MNKFVDLYQSKQRIKSKFYDVIEPNYTFTNKSLETLVQYHPTKTINEVEYFVYRIKGQGKKILFMKTKGYDESTIGLNTCLENYFGQYSDRKTFLINIKYAFRQAISNGKREKYYLILIMAWEYVKIVRRKLRWLLTTIQFHLKRYLLTFYYVRD